LGVKCRLKFYTSPPTPSLKRGLKKKLQSNSLPFEGRVGDGCIFK
jgi:hypothetical protein